jgi:3-hydroxyisobutyrate dehydrogenase-like beta-hydroxyacid dehydrogenase
VIVGLLHPGEMGSAVGDVLVGRGHEVLWASSGRSRATRARAAAFSDAGTADEVAARADVIVSICPPHAALDVAGSVGSFAGLYLDANAVSPQTAQQLAALFPRYVDGGIVGGPPREPGTRLYLSGPLADEAAALFEGSLLEPRVVGDASALKMAYSAWSKGSAALLLATRDVAERYGVGEALSAEWADSVPELQERLARAERSAAAKGWRWIGEMEEIADTFAAVGEPDGFHRAAAEVYRR